MGTGVDFCRSLHVGSSVATAVRQPSRSYGHCFGKRVRGVGDVGGGALRRDYRPGHSRRNDRGWTRRSWFGVFDGWGNFVPWRFCLHVHAVHGRHCPQRGGGGCGVGCGRAPHTDAAAAFANGWRGFHCCCGNCVGSLCHGGVSRQATIGRHRHALLAQ